MPYERSEAKVMQQIRDLMAVADGAPEGDPEREVALRRANRLMVKHAIDQAVLDASRTAGEKRVPTSMRFQFMSHTESAWEWIQHFRSLLGTIAQANRCRLAFHVGTTNWDVTLVGMQEDVEWCQMLWMRTFLEFSSRLYPQWVPGPTRTIGHNVAVFKAAGYKWEEIWTVGKRAEPSIDTNIAYDPKSCNYLMREYKKHLRMTGEEQVKTQSFEAYKYSFVQSYVITVSARVEQMVQDSKEVVDETSGSALALVDVSDRVDEEFYTLFPQFRPLTEEESRARRERWDREERARAAADQAFLASLSASERKTILDERAKEERRRARADNAYWRRESARQERLLSDSAGYNAGRAAGKAVDLSRGGPTVDAGAAAHALEGGS